MNTDLNWSFDPDTGLHKATKTCNVTGKEYSVFLTDEQHKAIYNQKELIQRVVPEMSIENREFLISGFTDPEWKEIFKDADTEMN